MNKHTIRPFLLRPLYEYLCVLACLFLVTFLYFYLPFWIVVSFIILLPLLFTLSLPYLFPGSRIYKGRYISYFQSLAGDHNLDPSFKLFKSSHTNAMACGAGFNNSIVMTTRFEKEHPKDELTAAMLHEFGHLKSYDPLRFCFLIQLLLFLNLLLVELTLVESFVGQFFLSFALSIPFFFLFLWYSRVVEHEADIYAKQYLKDASSFSRFFVRLLDLEKEFGTQIPKKIPGWIKLLFDHPFIYDRMKYFEKSHR